MSKFSVGDKVKLNSVGLEYFSEDEPKEDWADITHQLYKGGTAKVTSVYGDKVFVEDKIYFFDYTLDLVSEMNSTVELLESVLKDKYSQISMVESRRNHLALELQGVYEDLTKLVDFCDDIVVAISKLKGETK